MHPADGAPPRGARRASPLSAQHVLQHRLVQRQVGDQPLELGVLFLQLLQSPDLDDAHPGELLLPPVEGRLGDAELAADLLDCRAALGLSQREGDLLIRVALPLHGTLLQGSECPKKLRPRWTSSAGQDQFLNNVVEQGHRRVKCLVSSGLGLGSFHTARRTPAGYEARAKIRKGQVRDIGGRDMRAQVIFFVELFQAAA